MAEKFVILVVDDNANHRLTLRNLLTRLPGCKVLEAESGDAALLMTADHSIHLVLLDVQMPGMDGFETAHHLHITERTRDIPVVFMTSAYKAEEFNARGYELGAVDVLTTPIEDYLLLSQVRLYQRLHDRELAIATAMKAAEAADQQLRKLNVAVEQSPHSLFITNTEGIIEYVNPMFVENTGFTAPEAIGQKPSLLTSGKTPLASYQQLWNTVLAGKIWRGELINKKKNGTLYWVSSSVVPVHDTAGKVSHFVCMHVNITEKVQTQEELRQAKDAAEAANRAKSVFLSNMSHELRTPLNAVIGFSLLMGRSATLGEAEKKNLDIINRSGKHLLTLIDDILELTKIDAGQVVLQEELCDVHRITDEVADILRSRVEMAGLSLMISVDNIPAALRVDATKLQKILTNLLDNAVKFTPAGKIALKIKGSPTLGHAVRVDFEVSDTGIGIALEDQQRIFEPFVQRFTHATTSGTGLGLTITRQYLQMLGSELSVESTPGVGSSFRFTLTLPLPDEANIVPAGSNANHGTTQPDRREQHRFGGPTGVRIPARPPEATKETYPSDPDITAADLAALPKNLRHALGDAVMEMNPAKIKTVLAAIETSQPETARQLLPMIAAFRYRELWDLLKNSPGAD